MNWFEYPELEKYAETIASAMDDSMNINFADRQTEEIYRIVGRQYGYDYQEELLYRAKAIAQNTGKQRTTDNECPMSYKKKLKKKFI